MIAIKDEVNGLLAKLKTERDEIHLKLHLATMDVQQEFEVAEEKWAALKDKGEELARESADMTEEWKAKVDIVAEELSDAYQRIAKRLTE